MNKNTKKLLKKLLHFPTWLGEQVLKIMSFVWNKKRGKSKSFSVNRKSLIIALAIIVLLGPAVWLISKNPKKTEASWWDDGRMYRKAVEIDNSAGAAQTDFQVKITLDTATLITDSKMQSDCDDIRITDVNGKALPVWVAASGNKGCNESDTAIWTKVPSIPTQSIALYIYYGNPSVVSTSNGESVFAFFDDFEDGNLDKWDVLDDTYSCTSTSDTGQTRTGSRAMKLVDNDGASGCGATITSSARPSAETAYTLHFSARSAATSDFSQHPFRDSNGTYGPNTRYARSAKIQYYDGSGQDVQSYTANTWYDFELRADSSTDTYDIWINDIEKITSANFAAALTNLQYIQLSGHSTDTGKTWYYDRVFFRQYAATEPTIGSPDSEEQSPGPIAWWKMDEGYGSTINDSTENNNDGSLGAGSSAPEWQDESMCISGKCLKFDGTDSIVDFSTFNGSSFTNGSLSAWARTGISTTNHRVVEIGSASDRAGIVLNTSGQFVLYNKDGDVEEVNIISTNSFDDDKWHYIVGTWDSSGAILYVDGNIVASTTGDKTLTLPSDGTGYIGEYVGGGAYHWDGFIDEVKIYPFARSGAQIKTDYVKSSGSHGSSAVLGVKDQSYLSEGLVGYWKMDETSVDTCPTASADSCDNSGNSNDGTWNASTTNTTGKYSNGVTMDGSSDYINFGNDSSLSANSMTYSFWVKSNSATNPSDYHGLLFKASDTSASTREMSTQFSTDGSLAFGVTNGSQIYYASIPGDYYDATWHHVVAVKEYGTSNDVLKAYLDGALIDTTTMSGHGVTNSTNLEFGRVSSASQADRYLNGIVDELRVYNRALSPKEIRDLYNWAPGPVGHWKMDEKTGTTAYDTSSYGNNGTLGAGGSAPSWISGKYGGALSFDGTDDFVSVADPGTSTLDLPGAWTLSAWVNVNSSESDYAHIVSKRDSETNYGFRANSSGSAWSCYFYNAAWKGAWSKGSVKNDEWHHMTCTYDGSDIITIYEDGVEIGSGSAGAAPSTNDDAFLIGAYGNLNEEMDGDIDDVRVYNYARTPSQIIKDMNAGHPAPGSPVGSQASYWRMDEGYGSTTYDSSPQSNDGALGSGSSAPSWSNNGKYGKALDFDGSNDYTALSPSDALDFDGKAEISVCTWAKTDTLTGPDANKRTVFTLDQDGTDGVILRMLGSTAEFYVDQTGSGNQQAATKTSVFSVGQWVHLCGTYDGSNIRIYANSVEGTPNNQVGTINQPETDAWIGGQEAQNRYWDGLIDELKVYSFALTEDEIKLDYNMGKSLVLGANSINTGSTAPAGSSALKYCVPGDSTSCASPVAEWKMDEKTSTTAYDTSENSNTASMGAGDSAPEWKSMASCKKGSCLDFDGNNDYIQVSNNSSLNPSSELSISFWAKFNGNSPGTGTSSYGLIGKDAGSNPYGYKIRYETGKLEFPIDTTGTTGWDSNGYSWTPSLGVWYHIEAVYDGSKKYIYINGKEEFNQVVTGSIDNTSSSLYIGDTIYDSHFYGLIDQVKIYNYGRTPSQVAWDYNRGAPAAQWKLDDCEGTTIYDTSSNNNNGNISIGSSAPQTTVGSCGVGNTAAAWYNGVSGKFNSSLNLDGADDYISVAASSLINAEEGSPLTISAWVKTATTDTDQYIINKQENVANEFGYTLAITSGNKAYFNVLKQNDSAAAATGTSPISSGAWYHFTGVYDGSTVKIYVDGRQENSAPESFSSSTQSLANLEIGRFYNATNYFNGQIDEVQVYNYALTQEQIKNLYNQNSAIKFGPSEGSP